MNPMSTNMSTQTPEDELDKMLAGYAFYQESAACRKELKDEILVIIAQQRTQAVQEVLKDIWNKTQPDVVPEGWVPETLEAKLIQDRLSAITPAHPVVLEREMKK